MVELGAGCALPSLLAATLQDAAPSLVVITDYPDEAILANLRKNVYNNLFRFSSSCVVTYEAYEWGADVSRLL